MRRPLAILCLLCLANLLAIPAFAADAPSGVVTIDSVLEVIYDVLESLLEPFVGDGPEVPPSAAPPDDGDGGDVPNFGPTIIPIG